MSKAGSDTSQAPTARVVIPMLVSKDDYLVAGIHIGMKTCTPAMKRFVYKIREDGLAVFDLQVVDERLGVAASFLSRFSRILVASRKDTAAQAINAFAKATGATAIAGRFSPGTLTNPSYKNFTEPDVVLIADPLIDGQAIKEAVTKRIPIVALCGTFNSTRNIDLVVPLNNNGKKALALAFWVLAKELLKTRGQELSADIKEFGGDRAVPAADASAEKKPKKAKAEPAAEPATEPVSPAPEAAEPSAEPVEVDE